jgi:mycothione reductase
VLAVIPAGASTTPGSAGYRHWVPHYDLVIVGSGSGNSLVTPDLDDWRIAIVEQSVFGGTCLNVGCIPTKMFVYPAGLASHADDWQRLGLHGRPPTADWAAMRDRIFGRIDAISAGGREYRASGTPNVTLYEAHAEFTGPKTLRLSTGEELTAEHIVLATGSRAHVPPVIAESGVPFHTSDTIMRIDEVPRRIIILGGGYIAAEFAHIFSSFGAQVSVACRSRLLSGHDDDIAARFTDIVRDRWSLHQTVTITSVEHVDGEIRLGLADGATIVGDLLLVATGRVPNGDRLNLAAGGVQGHADGRIVVDEYQRTSAAGVWALGDASSEHRLKHVANHEERVVAHNLAHPHDLMASDHRFVPSAVFTHPQIASVGLTERQASDSGRAYVTATQAYGSTAYGWAMEDFTSVCKLIADPETGQLLGAHLMGEQASTLIQPLIQAMSFGLGVREMARGQYWIHPALTEVVENALLNLELK